MAAHLMYIINARALKRERVFRDRTNPFDLYDDNKMYKRYRFTRAGMMYVLNILVPELDQRRQTLRSHAVNSRLQVFIALRFYGSGSVYTSGSDHHGVSESTVCRVIKVVTDTLVELRDDHIVWPTTDEEIAAKQAELPREFYALICSFPRVIGAVDCTHVRLDSCPYGENEHVYVNRKGFHSINIQLISDAKYHIINVVARWPGSTHDSRIIQNSDIGQAYQRGSWMEEDYTAKTSVYI
ncbi:LOW QUALITY PROTEIN: putative nuclease HARBI1 [Amphiura filiformis]|uniref:LOW QUALITY PROTEIN: putative nuclease HARBI1 n=1 Tax=Amphiura filiformis TaxID=82378 RepID=UPI003B224306